MLKRFLAVLLPFLLVACTGDDADPQAPRSGSQRDYVAVYFLEGHGLAPEFRRLPAGDPVDGLLQLLTDGPSVDSHSTFLPEDLEIVDTGEREADESLAIELGPSFWSLEDGERFAASAQIVYTVATLEEGKRVFLLDGTVPGEVRDGNGDRVKQPLTREELSELKPWIQMSQPVAGAVVGHTIPVQAALRGRDATTILVQEDDLLARGRLVGGSVLLDVEEGEPGPVELMIELTADGRRHSVSLPLILSR